MKRILINATHPEEIRVAIVDGNYLCDLDIETTNAISLKGNIYKAKVKYIEKSLDAAFIDYGQTKDGFLPLRDLQRSLQTNKIDVGIETLVQVEKDERGKKGAALTSLISLPGRFIVLMPNKPNGSGISRKIEGEQREALKQMLDILAIPNGMSVIIRTACIGKTQEELQGDINYLNDLWKEIQNTCNQFEAPNLVYQESDVIIRTIRDSFDESINEILIDNKDVFKRAQEVCKKIVPKFVAKIKYYEDKVNLYNRYQIEAQIETAYQRKVKLKSGGHIVIDNTEALTSIDVNSAGATQGSNIEETAYKTNIEAAWEIARQLRIRDTGGLVVIDFIDMNGQSNRRNLESEMLKAIAPDRAKVELSQISEFGLMEMSRQRLRPSIIDYSHTVCPRCSGQGTIRDIESLSLSIIRLITEEALKPNTISVSAMVPIEVAAYLLNEKRDAIVSIEKSIGVNLLILPTPHFLTPEYEIQRVKDTEKELLDKESYKLIPTAKELAETTALPSKIIKKLTEPLVNNTPRKGKRRSIGNKLMAFFMGKEHWSERVTPKKRQKKTGTK